ncbi:MAG TPA: MBOAT family protein [Candidatus Acidoferrum sp.]|nr:MBOAT family protein [Candidatus Acidoferrum sp.]
MEGTVVTTSIVAENVSRPLPVPQSPAPRHGRNQSWVAWVPLLVLPLVCMAFRSVFVSWAFMWLLAGTIFAGCKWQTWWETAPESKRSWRRSAAYLLLWPGMNAEQFLNPSWKNSTEWTTVTRSTNWTKSTKRSVQPREWSMAFVNTLAGAALIAVASRTLLASHPLLSGWIAMIGIVLLLHFGTFQLISLAWQTAGVDAEPIMRHPLRSESLGELWGRRWNVGFRDLSHKLVFRPLRRRYGLATATLAVFLVSGLLHDLVISVPARAGYGLPTIYFLIQGLGVIFERSQPGKRLGIVGGIKGRVWTATIALGPIALLFHPWFVTRVIVPFLHAI